MRLLLATLALSTAISTALAQRRPPAPAARGPATYTQTCAQATSLVNRRGAVVMATGQNTFDRYVANETFCPIGYFARPAFVPTRDNPQCVIGYYCSGMSLFSR